LSAQIPRAKDCTSAAAVLFDLVLSQNAAAEKAEKGHYSSLHSDKAEGGEERQTGTGFTNISTIFLSFFYLFSKLLLNCF
jgi:hypothetical protein